MKIFRDSEGDLTAPGYHYVSTLMNRGDWCVFSGVILLYASPGFFQNIFIAFVSPSKWYLVHVWTVSFSGLVFLRNKLLWINFFLNHLNLAADK